MLKKFCSKNVIVVKLFSVTVANYKNVVKMNQKTKKKC